MARKVIPHEEVKQAFSEIYNHFYLPHRNQGNAARTEQQWVYITEDANRISSRFDSTLVNSMLNAIMAQFDNEDKEMRQTPLKGDSSDAAGKT